jgi:DNA modification methylase
MNVDNLRLAKDMKYEALYWALGFEELNKGIFTKVYNKNLKVEINADKQQVDLGNKISIVNGETLLLTTHKSFVILECIDKLLTMGYKPSEIIIDLDNEYDIYCKDLYIKCYEWNHLEEDKVEFKKDTFKSISYESRLISGVIERRTSIKTADGSIYNHGIFECESRLDNYNLYNSSDIISDDFIVKAGVATKYTGNKSIVVVPEGVTELAPCLFWDNQVIEEVILPDTLVNISGDTFYNSSNLRKVNIPKNVKFMGNNPFAGCPNIEVNNESPFFNLVDGILYNRDFTRLIYYPISKKDDRYEIKEGCRILGKHSFYLCDNLKEVVIPSSIIKLENNPFSGCTKINLVNKSEYYHIDDSVIYDKDYSSVIGCLNSINTDCLVLKDVKRICRNSFWNCKGIRKVVLPKTLESIGYNPFVSCSNIEFESNSENYMVYDNALYTADKSKLVCYPAKYAIGDIHLPDEVITLERGAFSGCDKMTNIHLHNVSIISKTCFTNCNSLERVYCSDLVTYIGEWAFAHCTKLKEISVYKDCFIDNNATLNSNVNINIRKELSNYVIESDNLYTLKSMTKSYRGKIKSILIDPPYNSHIDYIGYKDEFDSGYEKFMVDRFKLASELLTDDGFLVINIDEGEVDHLSSLSVLKNLFHRIQIYKWEKLHPYFDKNRNVNPNKKVVKYEFIIVCYKSKASKLNFIKQPYLDGEVLKEKESKVPSTFRCFGTNSSAKDEIAELFGDRSYFQTPKPLKLMKELVRATSNKDSIILDFFAGSGTVGHAVVDLNKEDGGSRKYILVSNNESNICKDVTLKRMQMVDDKVNFID